MIKTFNYTGKNSIYKLETYLNKRRSSKSVNTSIVNKIIRDVKRNKNKAVLKYEKKFSQNNQLQPSKEKINKAIKSLDIKVKKAIDFAYSRIFKFHSLQKAKNIKYVDQYKNKIEYKYVPIEKVGVYVPQSLPSTVLMNVIPAKIAGVKKIVLANPRLNGKLNAAVMYASKKCGVSEMISCGGAQAIGSLAYVQKVNKIIGPGNDYVAKAKQLVFGDVGIEGMIAGPSEIAVVADGKTDLNEVLTSMISQAEHDPESMCVLISKYKELIDKFKKEIKGKLKNLPRKNIASKSLKKNGLIVHVNNDKQIIDVINEVAPEHLELNVVNYKKYIKGIYNSGSIMLGKYSPMSASDYCIGPSHVLPTLGSAKFSSGLSVSDFYKKISYITLSKKGIEVIGKKAITLAENEGLIGHAQSIKSRMRSN
jgi:histidinol dehydrogenase